MSSSASTASQRIWILEPKQNRVGYYLIYAMGILQVFASAALVYYESSLRGYLLAAMLGNLALLFLAVARLLGLEKGGIAFDPQSKDWFVQGLGRSDFLHIPASEILGLAVERRTEYWGRSPDPVLVSSIHLLGKEGLRCQLLQMSSLQDAQERAEWIRDATGIAAIKEGGVVWDKATASLPMTSGVKIRAVEGGFAASIRTGVATPLLITLLLAALFCLVSGSLLLAGISVTGLVGALFDPLLSFLGLSLTLFMVVRRFGWQELTLKNMTLTSQLRLGAFRWSKQELPLQASCMVRIATRGVHGLHVEVLQGDKMVIVGAGSSTRSSLPPQQLALFARLVWHHIQTSSPTKENQP